jgi:hypothetical protein
MGVKKKCEGRKSGLKQQQTPSSLNISRYTSVTQIQKKMEVVLAVVLYPLIFFPARKSLFCAFMRWILDA